jgi:restriction system protein
MARQSAAARAARRREEAAFSFLIAGAGFLILPLFFRGSLLGDSLSVMIPLGFVVLAIGALHILFGRRPKRTSTSGSLRAREVPTLKTVLAAPEAASVDRVIEEFEPASQASMAAAASSRKPKSWGRDVFNIIEWRRFETVVEALFRQAGFGTKSQSHGADGGVNIWLYSRPQPEIPVGLVQCKHWSGKQIGVEKIRELRGVMAAKKVSRGIFATTSTFTGDAIQFGRDNRIDLLDIDRLLALIAQRTPEQQRGLLDVALEGEYWRPTCVHCGSKMVERVPRKGGNAFWGCPTYPMCRTTLPIRAAR